MKLVRTGSTVIVVAILLFAFINKQFTEGAGCHENLYWFKVVGNWSCSQISSQWQLLPIEDSNGDGCLTSIDFIACPASGLPYGCTDIGIKACSLGYRQTIGADNQIETFYENGLIMFRPKAFEISNYRCCVKRHTY